MPLRFPEAFDTSSNSITFEKPQTPSFPLIFLFFVEIPWVFPFPLPDSPHENKHVGFSKSQEID